MPKSWQMKRSLSFHEYYMSTTMVQKSFEKAKNFRSILSVFIAQKFKWWCKKKRTWKSLYFRSFCTFFHRSWDLQPLYTFLRLREPALILQRSSLPFSLPGNMGTSSFGIQMRPLYIDVNFFIPHFFSW